MRYTGTSLRTPLWWLNPSTSNWGWNRMVGTVRSSRCSMLGWALFGRGALRERERIVWEELQSQLQNSIMGNSFAATQHASREGDSLAAAGEVGKRTRPPASESAWRQAR